MGAPAHWFSRGRSPHTLLSANSLLGGVIGLQDGLQLRIHSSLERPRLVLALPSPQRSIRKSYSTTHLIARASFPAIPMRLDLESLDPPLLNGLLESAGGAILATAGVLRALFKYGSPLRIFSRSHRRKSVHFPLHRSTKSFASNSSLSTRFFISD